MQKVLLIEKAVCVPGIENRYERGQDEVQGGGKQRNL